VGTESPAGDSKKAVEEARASDAEDEEVEAENAEVEAKPELGTAVGAIDKNAEEEDVPEIPLVVFGWTSMVILT